MAFIGTPLDTRNTFQSLVGKRFSGDGSTTAFTLDVAPSSTLDIEVFVGNVRQDPNSAYTLSGTTLTFTGAPPSGTNNIYVVHQAKSVGTIGIPDDTISARTLVTLDNSADHVLIEDATDGELKKALIPAATSVADAFTINGSTPTLTIGDAGAEDTKIVFDGNAQDFHIGLDDSADDLVIGLGSTLGTTTHMSFDEAGVVTMPLQPAAIARTATQSNVTGDETQYTVTFAGSEVKDQNADFSSATFTAPSDGIYLAVYSVSISGLASDNTRALMYIVSSNRTYYVRSSNTANEKNGTGLIYNVSAIMDMDANDTVTHQLRVDGGTKGVDIDDIGSAGIIKIA